VRVLEIGNTVAIPAIARIMADFGAEGLFSMWISVLLSFFILCKIILFFSVIKVEPPKGGKKTIEIQLKSTINI
jgi:crotonobetainyl-CoA:carnitine CoA-transferase CaiB-like acyl-CoA transferase